MPIPDSVPAPSALELVHSRTLERLIRAEIDAAGGAIDFIRFMEMALYAPDLGYYMTGLRKFGEHGDFVTAPEMGDIFARCLARQCAQVLDVMTHADLLEFGAGSGALAADLLTALGNTGVLPARYLILEVSPELQARQRAALGARVPDYLDRVAWVTEPPRDFHGIVVANELIDALPVRRFRMSADGWRCVEVCWDGGFVETDGGEPGPGLEYLRDFDAAPGYCAEVGEQARAWIRGIAESISSGVVFIIDYGYPRHELYHPQRHMGTLTCHYRHRVHDDPYIHVGLQDITAHVDFTSLAEAAVQSGMSVQGFTTQSAFLLSLGITDLVEPMMQQPTPKQLRATQQVKKLTMPSEMGELFKVLALGKGWDQTLSGFAMVDHRGRL